MTMSELIPLEYKTIPGMKIDPNAFNFHAKIIDERDFYEGPLTEEKFDNFLKTEVWGTRYSGLQPKVWIVTPYQYLMIRYHVYIAFLFRKYRNRPLSKYFWIQLPKRLKDWYRWHGPNAIWWSIKRSWYQMYHPEWYEKRYDKDFNYDFEENLLGYVPPEPESEDWE
jgi:hypothetical protein